MHYGHVCVCVSGCVKFNILIPLNIDKDRILIIASHIVDVHALFVGYHCAEVEIIA